MLYSLLKYATLTVGIFLLVSWFLRARIDVSAELPMSDSTIYERQYETVVVDTLPESKEYMLRTSYLSQP